LDIVTCSYKEFPKLEGRAKYAPVGITLGGPPRFQKYPVRLWRALGPKSDYFKADPDVFTRRYVEDLDELGVDAILEKLTAIAEEEGTEGVALLCFEDLGNPALWCHRTLFREWWALRTGEALNELGRVYRAPAAPEPDLFEQLHLESGDRE
jgi:hypothetical protein